MCETNPCPIPSIHPSIPASVPFAGARHTEQGQAVGATKVRLAAGFGHGARPQRAQAARRIPHHSARRQQVLSEQQKQQQPDGESGAKLRRRETNQPAGKSAENITATTTTTTNDDDDGPVRVSK